MGFLTYAGLFCRQIDLDECRLRLPAISRSKSLALSRNYLALALLKVRSFLFRSTLPFYCSQQFALRYKLSARSQHVSVSAFGAGLNSVLYRVLRATCESLAVRAVDCGLIKESFTTIICKHPSRTCDEKDSDLVTVFDLLEK